MSDPFGCVGSSIKLRSGKYLDLGDPQPDQFDFADIAGALSKICRFGGQIESFYSVAEHAYHCSRVAGFDNRSLEEQTAVLMHDATEAFLGDCVKPLKNLLPEYVVIEWRMEQVIAEKFGIDFDKHTEVVKEIDRAMLIAERRNFFGSDGKTWAGEDEVRRLSIEFHCWDYQDAETMFVLRARELGIKF